MAATERKPRLSREQWLARALETLCRDGGARLRIDALVKEVGVTKGSFYWHFNNRQDFVRSILQYWHEMTALDVTEYIETLEGSPEQRLMDGITIVMEQRMNRYDVAIRSWAIQEPSIRPLVRRTDVFRHKFVRGLFEEMGFDRDAADTRTRALVAYLALYEAIFDKLSAKQRLAQVGELHALLVRQD
jgi:AcrR family transcriptional regulator